MKNFIIWGGSEVLERFGGIRVKHVALPTQNILHSNVAVGMILQAFFSGQLKSLL